MQSDLLAEDEECHLESEEEVYVEYMTDQLEESNNIEESNYHTLNHSIRHFIGIEQYKRDYK